MIVAVIKIIVMVWMEVTVMAILGLQSIISIHVMHVQMTKEYHARIVARLARWSVTRVSSVSLFWGIILTSNRYRIPNL